MDNNNNKQQDKAEVRNRIVRCSLALFKEQGIKQVKMDDIASHLSISKRTLYELFKDKEQLLYECAQANHIALHNDMLKMAKQNNNILETILYFYEKTINDLRLTNPQYFEDIKRYPRIYQQLKNGRNEDSSKSIDYFKKGIEQGIFRSDINYEICLTCFHKQLEFAMESDYKLKYELEEILDSTFIVLLRGISTSKGLVILDDFINKYKSNRNKNRN